MNAFRHLGNPELIFGAGAVADLPAFFNSDDILLVVSGKHFAKSESCLALEKGFRDRGVGYTRETVSGEPSPETVDSLVATARGAGITRVVAIGGGSVVDAGKAVAAMLRHHDGVVHYLEGVGDRSPRGETVPMVAVPTTAGTGSEATKNAVISRRGRNGFKKSLRHDAFVPSKALIDPALAVGCPSEISLACGMDAFCQLLESYISTDATPLTDVLAREGVERFGRGSQLFTERFYGSDRELGLRAELSMAAYYSGLALANAGLGAVHGLAAPLGAYCDVPHGVACGLLLAPIFRRLAGRLHEIPDGGEVRRRLAWTGAALSGKRGTVPDESDIERLLDHFDNWAQELPRLSSYGLERENLGLIVDASGNKNFPVALEMSERREVLEGLL